jgi:uncharacterized protein
MVHQYKLNGFNIVLDSCSGAVHDVDEVAYDMIAMFENSPKEEIIETLLTRYSHRKDVTKDELEECYADILSLKESGQLFTEDTFEDMAGTFKERSGNVIKALCLHVAHTCNLNCSYCFASQGKFHGERAVMSLKSESKH